MGILWWFSGQGSMLSWLRLWVHSQVREVRSHKLHGLAKEKDERKVKVAHSCLTLCDSIDYIVHGILQARILEWVAFPFSRGIFPTQGLNPGQSQNKTPRFALNHVAMLTDFEAMLCCAHLLQSCLTFCDPVDCSLPGSSVSYHSLISILQKL